MNLDRLNYINILLMLLSLIGAVVVPIELFLFAYAILGPLHYLTEISWLHDRKYFSNSKSTAFWLVAIASVISFGYFNNKYKFLPELTYFFRENNINAMMIIFAFLISIGFSLLKTRLTQLLFLIISSLICLMALNSRSETSLFISLTLPTIIHVYFFTGLFILSGSLKNHSRSGHLSLLVYVLCPLMLWTLFPEFSSKISDYGVNNFFKHNDGFGLFIYDLLGFLPENYFTILSGSNLYEFKEELFLVRLFAFAYLYHYLNWFSKTEIIKWHQIPRRRLQIIIVLWLISCGIYFYDYALGMSTLFLLSYCHVLLEFPLNIRSIKEFFTILTPNKRQ